MATGDGNSPGDDDYSEYEETEVEEEVEEEEEEDEGRPGGGAAAQAELLDSGGRRSGADANGSSSQGKLFVGGITWETTEETFVTHFKRYGEILDYVIMRDKHTQNPRGFGFVTFADPSVVEAVLKVEHVIDGKTVEVKRTVPKNSPSLSSKVGSKTKKIFVGGLPPHLSEDEFKDYFTFYGVVVEHAILLDHSTGRSRGFGFITFEDEKTVDEIMAEGKIHEFGGKQVELKRAVPKTAANDSKVGRAAGLVSVPVGGGVYGSYGGGALGYGGGYGYGGVAGAYGRGYGYAAGYEYGMGLLPAYAGSMYGYGGGFAGYGAGAGSGYGLFRGMGQSGGRYHPYGR